MTAESFGSSSGRMAGIVCIRSCDATMLRSTRRRRPVVASTHELLTEYCLATGQTHVYAAQPWYQFARVLRNAVVHYRGEYVSRWPDAMRRRGVVELRWRHLVLRDRVGELVSLADAD